nr:ACT domain-containing protein [Neptunomonas sp. XY-337]
MMTSLVLSVIGPDKPGLVESLAQTVASHGGNWLESGLSHLGGKFAGIVIVDIDEAESAQLQHALNDLASDGLIVTSEVITQADNVPPTQPLTIELIGHDKPGIVREISQALAKRHVNVEQLTTALVSGSMSAELLFKAEAQLLAPETLDLDDLQADLENIASDLMVDISLNK